MVWNTPILALGRGCLHDGVMDRWCGYGVDTKCSKRFMQWGGFGNESEVCKLGFDPGSIGRVLAQRQSRREGFVDDPSAEFLKSSTQLDSCTKPFFYFF